MIRRRSLAAALALFAASTATAFAHAHLKSAQPASGSAGPSPSEIRLTFSDPVEPNFTGAVLTASNGRITTGAPHLDPADPHVLVVPLPSALPAGSVMVEWHAMARDGHKTGGHYAFTVRP